MGKTAKLLEQCARVAGQGHDVAFVVRDRKDVRDMRDLCAAQVKPCAVAKGRLYYGTGSVLILTLGDADWRLRTWGGFAVLHPDFDLSSYSDVTPDEARAMRDLRDLVNMQHPDGEFARLALGPVIS